MLRYASVILRLFDLVLTRVIQAERDPEEEGDYMAFEQLMAEAMTKKGKDEKKKKEKKKHGRDSQDQESEEKPTAA